MEFKQLQSFAAVVKYQSFTKAAEKLFLSQPTVSAHVSTLEEELGKRLILRTTKSIELTPKAIACRIYTPGPGGWDPGEKEPGHLPEHGPHHRGPGAGLYRRGGCGCRH